MTVVSISLRLQVSIWLTVIFRDKVLLKEEKQIKEKLRKKDIISITSY